MVNVRIGSSYVPRRRREYPQIKKIFTDSEGDEVNLRKSAQSVDESSIAPFGVEGEGNHERRGRNENEGSRQGAKTQR